MTDLTILELRILFLFYIEFYYIMGHKFREGTV